MEISKTGFILYTIKYKACVDFYRDVLNLNVLYVKESLTCFEFGGSYLMVEVADDIPEDYVESSARDKTCLRMNMPDVAEACKVLDKHGVPYEYNEFEWGTIAKFRDPDGNLIGFRSAIEHESDSKK